MFALTDEMLDCVRTSRGTVDDGVGGISVSLIERRSGLDEGLAKCSAIKVNESDLSLLGMVPLPIENSVQVRGIDPKYDQEGNPYPGFSGTTGCIEQNNGYSPAGISFEPTALPGTMGASTISAFSFAALLFSIVCISETAL